MIHFLRRLVIDKRGTTAVEYGLIIAFIVLIMLVSLSQVATKTIAMWQRVAAAYVVG
jgi:pilus assembly protein Flp/PilA